MPPRSYIEAIDRPTVIYILYTMVSAQQTNLLPKNASRNDAIFTQKVYRIYAGDNCHDITSGVWLWQLKPGLSMGKMGNSTNL